MYDIVRCSRRLIAIAVPFIHVIHSFHAADRRKEILKLLDSLIFAKDAAEYDVEYCRFLNSEQVASTPRFTAYFKKNWHEKRTP